MRRVNYDDYVSGLKKKALRFYTAWAAGAERAQRAGKPRSFEEDAVLFLLDYMRWQKSLADGRIEKVAPQRYRMK